MRMTVLNDYMSLLAGKTGDGIIESCIQQIYEIFSNQVSGYVRTRYTKEPRHPNFPEHITAGDLIPNSGPIIENPFAAAASLFHDYPSVITTSIAKIRVHDIRRLLNRHNFEETLEFHLERFDEAVPIHTMDTICAGLFYLHVVFEIANTETPEKEHGIMLLCEKIYEITEYLVNYILHDLCYDPAEVDEFPERSSAYQIFIYESVMVPLFRLGMFIEPNDYL
jgi:hypothetical protein